MVGIPVVAVTIWLCNVSGFWIAFGNQLYRFAVIPVPFLMALFLNWLAGGNELGVLSAFFYGIAVVVTITAVGLRVTFGELRRDFKAEAKDALQFNLWQMFILITTGRSIDRCWANLLSAGMAEYVERCRSDRRFHGRVDFADDGRRYLGVCWDGKSRLLAHSRSGWR